MSLMPTEPRSIGGVIDDAIRLYRRTLSASIPIALIGVLLLLVPSIWAALRIQALVVQQDDPLAVWQVFAAPELWLFYLMSVVVYALIYGAMIFRIDAIARGHSASLGESFAAAVHRLPAMLGVSLLFGLAIMVGFVLLIIPGIWLWGILQLAFIAVIVDRSGVLASFATSRQLVRGNWWRANIVIFVSFVIMFVVIAVLGGIAGFIVGVTGAAAAASSTGGQVVQQIINAVLNTLTLSFYPCVLMAVFNDLRLRREGGDLLGRVDALSPAG